MVHGPQWSDTRLRMGLLGRKPARTRMGGLQGLRDRQEKNGQGGHRLFKTDIQQTVPELYLVGQQKGP